MLVLHERLKKDITCNIDLHFNSILSTLTISENASRLNENDDATKGEPCKENEDKCSFANDMQSEQVKSTNLVKSQQKEENQQPPQNNSTDLSQLCEKIRCTACTLLNYIKDSNEKRELLLDAFVVNHCATILDHTHDGSGQLSIENFKRCKEESEQCLQQIINDHFIPMNFETFNSKVFIMISCLLTIYAYYACYSPKISSLKPIYLGYYDYYYDDDLFDLGQYLQLDDDEMSNIREIIIEYLKIEDYA